MLLLIFFAFLAGVVTILSPCILPVLPIVLSSSINAGKKRPLGIVTGFVLSFTFFTLFLATLVKLTGISADVLRMLSVIVIFIFGLSLLTPRVQVLLEQLFSKLSNRLPLQKKREGFWGGILIGISLGLLWTPCVGPILASVISLVISSAGNPNESFLPSFQFLKNTLPITFAYALGTGIPMLAITYGGRKLFTQVPWLLKKTARIQQVFGLIMMVTAIGIYFNIDRKFQTWFITTFPNYGVGLTKFEEAGKIKTELEKLQQKPVVKKDLGKPMFNLLEDNVGLAPEIIPGGEWFNPSASSGQVPSASSGQVPSASSGQVPSASSGQVPSASSGQVPSASSRQVSTPLTIRSLRGKVVIVDFWTYTCINCQRTLPYLKNWYAKYKDKGLVIIGVHAPEFEFEKNPVNVAQAIKDFGLTYPIVQDNNFATWKAYNNNAWPAKYFIDKNGKIRWSHFGEGAYDESEQLIQKLLGEMGQQVDEPINNPKYSTFDETRETYLGYDRLQFLVSPETVQPDKIASYSIPQDLLKSRFAYGGMWMIGGQYASPEPGAKIELHFVSKEVYLVMRPKAKPGQVKLLLDGQLLSNDAAGKDIKTGLVLVDSDKLYTLINLKQPGDHILTLEFLDNSLEVYAFTFG